MKNGFRVYDSDTHINPAAEILDKYVDPDFRVRLPELAPYRAPAGDRHNYRAGTKFYRRILGEEAPRETFTGRESRWMGSRKPRPGTQDDQADNRVMDMDDEGTDVHFLIPTSWLSLVGVDDTSIEVALIRAFHRHMAEFCGSHPDRLKGPIIASTRRVDEAVREIRAWGKAKWAVAVMPLLAEGLPADHPSLEPIWREAQEHDLPIANHSFTWTPPYYPGYRDLYDNIFLGRLAAHPWGAMRFAAAFIGGGVFDRYPQLRMGVLECGSGWLPFWTRRTA
jgi:predicted TIM-barrel fold metal-dependent hydrolase